MDPMIDTLARREVDRLNEKSKTGALSLEEADLLKKYTDILKSNEVLRAADEAATRPYLPVTDEILIEQVTKLRDSGIIKGPQSVEKAD